jgi:hypothetical protein
MTAGMLAQNRIPGNNRGHQLGNCFADDERGIMPEQLAKSPIAEPAPAVSVGMEQGTGNRIDQGF